jgi:penicillin amidase
MMGRNPDFAWGLTAAYIDDADIYIEKLSPTDPERYLTPDGDVPFITRTEVIALPDGRSDEVTLRWTRHGPVLSPDHFGVGTVTPAGHVAALAWTALQEDDRSISTALALMTSRSIDEGEVAAAMHGAPGMNVTMADANDVGMVVAGRIPLRRADSPSRGRLPTPGWIATGDWQGWAPPEANPRVMRPASGAVANTNNRTTNAAYPLNVSFRFGDDYRIIRLDRALSGREFHTRDSAQALQSDAVSEMARAILPLIARDLWWSAGGGANPSDPATIRRATALDMLGDWNGEMSAHTAEPLIFAEWMRRLTIRLAEDELGPLIAQVEGPQPVFVERVFKDIEGAAIWCDVNKTPKRESCADIAALALDDALASLAETYGDAPEGWRWGEAHRGIHRNEVLTRNPITSAISDIEHQMSGGDYTLLRAQSRGTGETPHAAIHGAGFRMVVDFADPNASMFIIATGQSGHPLSRHYDDMSERWQRGDMVRMSLDPGDAAAGALGVSVLRRAK